jgi:SAM-dependent methyltransferase
VNWLQGRGEQMAFAPDGFDLIFSVDVIHHVADKEAYFREVVRTLKPGGSVCTVTDSEEGIRSREILSGYFPETVACELVRYPRLAQLEAWMAAAGLVGMETRLVEEPYRVTSLEPFRHKAYSSLHLIPEGAWQAGLERLEQDLARGPVCGMSRYACLWGRKPRG